MTTSVWTDRLDRAGVIDMFSAIKSMARGVRTHHVIALSLVLTGAVILSCFVLMEDRPASPREYREAEGKLGALENFPMFTSPHRRVRIKTESGDSDILARVSIKSLQAPTGEIVKVRYRGGFDDAFIVGEAPPPSYSSWIHFGRLRVAAPGWAMGLVCVVVGLIVFIANAWENKRMRTAPKNVLRPVLPAGAGRRLVAGWIDAALVSFVSSGILGAFNSGDVSLFVVASVVVISVGTGYHLICNGLWGRSLGKKIIGIRIVLLSGQKIGWKNAALRALPSLICCIPVQLIIIATWAKVPVEMQSRLMQDSDGHMFSWFAPEWGSFVVGTAVTCVLADLICIVSNPGCRSMQDMVAGTIVTGEPVTPLPGFGQRAMSSRSTW